MLKFTRNYMKTIFSLTIGFENFSSYFRLRIFTALLHNFCFHFANFNYKFSPKKIAFLEYMYHKQINDLYFVFLRTSETFFTAKQLTS